MATVREIERLCGKKTSVLSVSVEANVAHAATKMSQHGVGCLIVTDTAGRALGILSERDIISRVVARSMSPAATRVAEVMTTEMVSCGMDTEIAEAKEILARKGIRHLPIIEDGVAQGMISVRDIMAYQLSATGALAKKQSLILTELERQYPGITSVQVNSDGWVVL